MSSVFRIAVVATIAALGLTGVTPASAARRPGGSVKIASFNLKVVAGGVRCGWIEGAWVPGTALPKGYFVSHAQQAKNFKKAAKRLHGKARKQALAKAASFTTKARRSRALCSAPVTAGVAPIPTMPITTGPAGSPVTHQATPLRFRIAGSAGLALRSTQGRTRARDVAGSNLMVVSDSGTIADAVSSGSATVSRFLIAPNGKVYVLFSIRVNLSDTSDTANAQGCLLAELDPVTGVPACIDSTLSYVNWNATWNASNPPVQFDADGAIYYTGSTYGGKTVLRKNAGGTITDLVTDNANVSDFLVTPSGVFISGQTGSTGTQWTRRVRPDGSLQPLASTHSTFLRRLPDGNVYFGLWGPDDFGIKRFVSDAGQVESKYWLTGDVNGIGREGYFYAGDYCSGPDSQTRAGFCGTYGTISQSFFSTTDGKFFGVAGGTGSQRGTLTQYFPQIAFPETTVKSISVAQGLVTNLVLAGLNAAGQNVMTIFNTTNGVETPLIGPADEIEVYHVNYVASENKIMFDGLRFSDNRYVIGQVDLGTGNQVSVSTTTSAKLDDFQTFG